MNTELPSCASAIIGNVAVSRNNIIFLLIKECKLFVTHNSAKIAYFSVRTPFSVKNLSDDFFLSLNNVKIAVLVIGMPITGT